jgi:hypothetical protein
MPTKYGVVGASRGPQRELRLVDRGDSSLLLRGFLPSWPRPTHSTGRAAQGCVTRGQFCDRHQRCMCTCVCWCDARFACWMDESLLHRRLRCFYHTARSTLLVIETSSRSSESRFCSSQVPCRSGDSPTHARQPPPDRTESHSSKNITRSSVSNQARP